MPKNLTDWCVFLADDSRKEDQEDHKSKGEQVEEVLLAIEVLPSLQDNLLRLFPKLPQGCGKEDKWQTIGVDHQEKNAKEQKNNFFPRC